jgi:hypothetical protein
MSLCTQRVHQRGLAVVDVAHEGHDRRPQHLHLAFGLLDELFHQLVHGFLVLDDLDVAFEFQADQLDLLVGQHRVDVLAGDLQLEHERRQQVGDLDAERFRERLHRDRFFDLDDLVRVDDLAGARLARATEPRTLVACAAAHAAGASRRTAQATRLWGRAHAGALLHLLQRLPTQVARPGGCRAAAGVADRLLRQFDAADDGRLLLRHQQATNVGIGRGRGGHTRSLGYGRRARRLGRGDRIHGRGRLRDRGQRFGGRGALVVGPAGDDWLHGGGKRVRLRLGRVHRGLRSSRVGLRSYRESRWCLLGLELRGG